MRFYYFSIIGTFLALAASGVLVMAVWLVWTKLAGRKLTTRVVAVSIPVALLLPWTEEFWIAWNFGQLCRKDAGLVVNGTVKAAGFYDDTGGGSLELVRSGMYAFVETRGVKGIRRITAGDTEFMKEALARFQLNNPGKDSLDSDVVRVKFDETTEALIFPKKGDSWRITSLDKPTARYRFRMDSGSSAGYKVTRQESAVEDSERGELLGRYLRYSRGQPWNYIGLGAPPYACDGPDGGPHTKQSLLIYRDVLIPVK